MSKDHSSPGVDNELKWASVEAGTPIRKEALLSEFGGSEGSGGREAADRWSDPRWTGWDWLLSVWGVQKRGMSQE